eukprot:Nk52_evm83s221 gene=Nk52_evmTU83s221
MTESDCEEELIRRLEQAPQRSLESLKREFAHRYDGKRELHGISYEESMREITNLLAQEDPEKPFVVNKVYSFRNNPKGKEKTVAVPGKRFKRLIAKKKIFSTVELQNLCRGVTSFAGNCDDIAVWLGSGDDELPPCLEGFDGHYVCYYFGLQCNCGPAITEIVINPYKDLILISEHSRTNFKNVYIEWLKRQKRKALDNALRTAR